MSTNQNTEEIILQAAEAEFIEKGYSGSRTTSIADRAGVSHTMLHYYFRKKEVLFDRVLQEKIKTISGEIARVLQQATGQDIRYKILQIAKSHLNVVKDQPQLPFFLITELKNDPDWLKVAKEGLTSFLTSLVAQYQHELDAAAEQGLIAKDVRFIDLMMDIVSLNIMTVVLADMIIPTMQIDRDDYLQRREQEIITMIEKRLKP